MTRRLRFGVFLGLGLAGAALVVVVLAPHASREPDGLEKVAIEEGFAGRETTHALEDAPTAGYTIEGSGGAWGTVAAGLLGVAVTFALAGGLVLLARRRPVEARGGTQGTVPAAGEPAPGPPASPPRPGGSTATEGPPGAARGVAAG